MLVRLWTSIKNMSLSHIKKKNRGRGVQVHFTVIYLQWRVTTPFLIPFTWSLGITEVKRDVSMQLLLETCIRVYIILV